MYYSHVKGNICGLVGTPCARGGQGGMRAYTKEDIHASLAILRTPQDLLGRCEDIETNRSNFPLI